MTASDMIPNDMNKDAHYPHRSRPAPVRSLFWLTFVCLATATLLGGCASTGRPASAEASRPYGLGEDHYREPTALSAAANDVLMRAIGLVGTPYRYGGNTPAGGFDCSGLVDFVFNDAAGLMLPRSTREIIDIHAPKVDRDNLQPGDLIFFNPRGGKVSHIGIYVGEGRFVHAPSKGGTVRLDRLDDQYWSKYFVGAKRVLR